MREIITDTDKLGGYATEVNIAKEGVAVRAVISELKNIIREKNLVCLSAPQIGVDMRVFVISFNGDLQSFINPVYTVKDRDAFVFEYIETCPCLPNRRFIRPRYNDIEILYTTPLGTPKQSRLVGMSAVAYQYCVDHLNGLLLSDVALEIYDDYESATEEERMELIKWYKDSLDVKKKELEEEIAKDDVLKKTSDAIDFMEKIRSGDVKISEEAIEVSKEAESEESPKPPKKRTYKKKDNK